VWESASRIAKRSYPLTKHLVLRKLNKANGTPLVVFAMSKTASTAIYNALFGNVPNPVLRTHMLSPYSLARVEQKYRETDPKARPTHLFHGFYLSQHPPTPVDPWLIVTIVRDPIARAISNFFQGGQRFGRLHDPSTLVEKLTMFVRNNGVPRSVNWFDDEFKPSVGVDVYAHPFDGENGYGIIDFPHARVLLLRQESLDLAPVALSLFLDLPERVNVAKENVGSDKEYKDEYARVLREVKFSQKTLDMAYGSCMARHFYLPDEIAEFRRRWKR
jgi:hypothetical protein